MRPYYRSSEAFTTDFADYLDEAQPTNLVVITYNLYSGISNFHRDIDGVDEKIKKIVKGEYRFNPKCGIPKYLNPTQRILTVLNKVKGYLVINQLDQGNESISLDRDIWPDIKWQRHEKCHLKQFTAIKNGNVELWSGSANLSDSTWHDSFTKMTGEALEAAKMQMVDVIRESKPL